MPDRERYSLETDLEEAEAAARDLPDQIARVRAEVRRARRLLSGGGDAQVGRGES